VIKMETTCRITEIVKPTKARMFEDLQVGDTLILQTTIKHLKHYKPYVLITCPRLEVSIRKSFNELSNILTNFKLEN
jgi:hypothetical protein